LQQKTENKFKKSVTYVDDYYMVNINNSIDLSLTKKKSRNSSSDMRTRSKRDSEEKKE
jgi:hypothetical protein